MINLSLDSGVRYYTFTHGEKQIIEEHLGQLDSATNIKEYLEALGTAVHFADVLPIMCEDTRLRLRDIVSVYRQISRRTKERIPELIDEINNVEWDLR